MRPDRYRIKVRRGFSGRLIYVVYRPRETLAVKTAMSRDEAYAWIAGDIRDTPKCPNHQSHGHLLDRVPRQVTRL